MIRLINWRGLPYYIAKSTLGPHQWKTNLRLVKNSNIEILSSQYLKQLLEYACQHVPFYRALHLANQPLHEYPLLTKADVRAHYDYHKTDELMKYHWSEATTSGSTGDTLRIVRTQDFLAWVETADMWFYNRLLSTSRRACVSSSKIYVWGQSGDPHRLSVWTRLARFVAPIMWLDPYEALSEEQLLYYALTIRRVKPAYIWGFAGVLYEIAKTALRHHVHLQGSKFVVSSGETLHTFMRPVIEEGFGCRVYDYYGSTEAGRVAGECHAGNLHTFDFSCHVEVLDPSGQPTPPGQEGRIVLTPLHNYAMPLIRYDTADMAQVGPRECPCGCELGTLSRIAGRTVEFFVTREGHLISGGRIAKMLRICHWIIGFQIFQNDIDQLTIFYCRTADTVASQQDIEKINEGIGEVLGVSCHIDWQEVAEIPRTANGKRPYARSLVWEDKQPGSLWELE